MKISEDKIKVFYRLDGKGPLGTPSRIERLVTKKQASRDTKKKREGESMVHSRNKGKRGELEVAELLRSFGFEARRGQQFSGGNESPDVVHSLPNFHIEVKRTESLSIYAAMEQAEDDRKDTDVPIIFHRRSNKSWLVIMHADDFLDYAKRNSR